MAQAHGTDTISKQCCQTIYFVIGAALHNTRELNLYYLGTGDYLAAQLRNDLLRNSLTYSSCEEALADNMPCRLVQIRERATLLYVRKQLFELSLEMEEHVFIPLLESGKILACLGNRLSAYLECQLVVKLHPERIAVIFEVALGMASPSEPLTDRRMSKLLDDDAYLPVILAQKLYRYYIGSCFNDFVKHKVRALKHDKDFGRKLAFRNSLLIDQEVRRFKE